MYHKTLFGRYNWNTGLYDFKKLEISIKRQKDGKYEVKRQYWDGDSYSQIGLCLIDAIKKFKYWINENDDDNARKIIENFRTRGKNETNL